MSRMILDLLIKDSLMKDSIFLSNTYDLKILEDHLYKIKVMKHVK